jgi:hypothetical protein
VVMRIDEFVLRRFDESLHLLGSEEYAAGKG